MNANSKEFDRTYTKVFGDLIKRLVEHNSDNCTIDFSFNGKIVKIKVEIVGVDKDDNT